MEIGRGVQYKVIDLGNGRVRKIPLTQEESREILHSWYGSATPKNELENLASHKEDAITSCLHIQQTMSHFPDFGPLVGNPHFEDQGIYTQDKAKPLEHVLSHANTAKSKQLLDGYVSSTLMCWQYGFSERVFNFSVNNGLDDRGCIVLLDFGEISTDKNEVIAR